MRYLLFSVLFIVLATITATFIPTTAKLSENLLTPQQTPLNNAAVAGIEIYNIPPTSKNLPVPQFSARSVLIKDLATGTILFQKDANLKLPIASTTKIMTALVASGYFKQNSVLVVGEGAKIEGSRVGLNVGEELSFRSLLYGMLLNSGNDAAYTIAENYPGGILGFISAMNKEVEKLKLPNTHFTNPAGFDDPAHYSSAEDLSVITEEALRDPELSKIFATKDTQILSLDKKYTYQLHNLNKLLTSVSGVMGVKTGFTDLAKENLVTLVERNNHKILVVVLGSDDRFGESTNLIEWTYQNFTWAD